MRAVSGMPLSGRKRTSPHASSASGLPLVARPGSVASDTARRASSRHRRRPETRLQRVSVPGGCVSRSRFRDSSDGGEGGPVEVPGTRNAAPRQRVGRGQRDHRRIREQRPSRGWRAAAGRSRSARLLRLGTRFRYTVWEASHGWLMVSTLRARWPPSLSAIGRCGRRRWHRPWLAWPSRCAGTVSTRRPRPGRRGRDTARGSRRRWRRSAASGRRTTHRSTGSASAPCRRRVWPPGHGARRDAGIRCVRRAGLPGAWREPDRFPWLLDAPNCAFRRWSSSTSS